MERSKIFYLIGLTMVFLMLFVFTPGSFAQFSLNSALNVSFDDNIFNNYESTHDQVSELYLGLSNDFDTEKSNLQLYYDGSLSYYRKNVSRTFHQHTAGISYSNVFGKNINTTLNLGAYFDAVFNRTVYSYLDTRNVSAFGNIKHYLSKRVAGLLGYRFGYIMFKEFPDLNYIDNNVITRVTGYLPSKTTLSIESDLVIKTYTEIFEMGSGQGRHGQSRMRSSSNESVIQIAVSGRIAQSMFELTGLSGGVKYQKNITDESRFVSTGTVLSVNDVFEDYYAYEGPVVDVSITQGLPWNIMANVSVSYQYKKYRNHPAYDLNQVEISGERIDKVTAVALSLEKDFNNLGFGIYYTYLNNISNDAYYNFRNNVFTVGLNAGF